MDIRLWIQFTGGTDECINEPIILLPSDPLLAQAEV